jgi:hypothetical protein
MTHEDPRNPFLFENLLSQVKKKNLVKRKSKGI